MTKDKASKQVEERERERENEHGHNDIGAIGVLGDRSKPSIHESVGELQHPRLIVVQHPNGGVGDGGVSVMGGFMYAYQNSTGRLKGLFPNNREVARYQKCGFFSSSN